MRDRDAEPVAQLHDGTGQRVDLHRPARLEVLQHRRLVVAHARGALDPLLDGHRNLDPEAPRHRIDLLHGRADHLRDQRRLRHVADGRARERAQRIEDGVAQQLEPQLGADVRLDRRLQPRAHERPRELDAARALAAVQLAERESLALGVAHDPWTHKAGGRVDDAPDDPVGIDCPRDDTARVDGLQVDAVQVPSMALEVPPRDPVLGADDGGVVAEIGCHSLHHRGEAVGLEGDKNCIRVPHRREVVGRLHGHRPVTAALDDAKTRVIHRLQVRAARDEDDIRAGARQARTQEATDRACAKDNDFHARVSCSATNRRWTLPVGVRGIDSTKCSRLGTLKSASRSRE